MSETVVGKVTFASGGYVPRGNSDAREWLIGDQPAMQSCFCRGPQNGQPLCPCQMRGVAVKDGRYVRIQDLGPVRDEVTFTTVNTTRVRKIKGRVE